MTHDNPVAGDFSDTEGDQAVWNRRETTMYRAWVQLRYHRRRQWFFDKLDKETKALTLVLGASLFGKHLTTIGGLDGPWIATGISALSLLSLVYAYGDRKQIHKDLAEQSALLIASMEAVPPANITPDHVARWGSDLARLYAKAPPPLKVLTVICEREQSLSQGDKNPAARQYWWGRRLIADYY